MVASRNTSKNRPSPTGIRHTGNHDRNYSWPKNIPDPKVNDSYNLCRNTGNWRTVWCQWGRLERYVRHFEAENSISSCNEAFQIPIAVLEGIWDSSHTIPSFLLFLLYPSSSLFSGHSPTTSHPSPHTTCISLAGGGLEVSQTTKLPLSPQDCAAAG